MARAKSNKPCATCGGPLNVGKYFCSLACRRRVHPTPIIERLMKHVEISESGCWIWTGHVDKTGYGRIRMKTGSTLAHCVSYEAHVGPIPSGLELDHTCHKRDQCSGGWSCPHRRCINWEHLEPVTPIENNRRGWSGENSRAKTHCPQGHEYSPENTARYAGRRQCKQCFRERSRQRRALASKQRLGG